MPPQVDPVETAIVVHPAPQIVSSPISLDDLPTDPAELGRAIRFHEGKALEHAYESGRLLLRARQCVPHGGWDTWLEKHFPLSPRVAQERMAMTEWIGQRPALLAMLGDVSTRKVRALMSAPAADLAELERTGTLGGLPLGAVTAQSYSEVTGLVKQLQTKQAELERDVGAKDAEITALRDALAESTVAPKRADYAAKWLARVDEVHLKLETVVTTQLEKMLDDASRNWDDLPPAAQSRILGLLQMLEQRFRLEALLLADRLAPSPKERIPPALIADTLLVERSDKEHFPLPERRLPDGTAQALHEEGLDLGRINPGGLTARTARGEGPQTFRDVTVPMVDGRVVSVPKGSALPSPVLAAFLADIEAGKHGPAVETYQLHVNVSAAKARAAVKSVAEALVRQKSSPANPAPTNPAPANNNPPIDQGDF